MSRPSKKVSMAPLAVTSDGSLIINLTQFQNDASLEALVARAKEIGLPVFVGIVVPSAVQGASVGIVDDAAAEVAGRLGGRSARRLPPGLRRRELHRVEVNARAGLHVHEVDDLDLQRPCDGEERVDGGVPLRALNLGKVPEGQARLEGRVGLRPTKAPPSTLNACRDSLAKGLGAHPRDESRSRYKNVTHSDSPCSKETSMVRIASLLLFIAASTLLTACKDSGSGTSPDAGLSPAASVPTRPSASAAGVYLQRPASPPLTSSAVTMTCSSRSPPTGSRESGVRLGGHERSELPCARRHQGNRRVRAARRGVEGPRCLQARQREGSRVPQVLSVLMRATAEIGKYDFGHHSYPLTVDKSANVTKSGNVLLWDAALVTWPGVQRSFDHTSGGVSASSFCQTRVAIGDAVSVLTGMWMDLPMSEDAAKQFRDTMKKGAEDNPQRRPDDGAVQIAVRLEGTTGREDLACDAQTPNALRGRVVAWRVETLAPHPTDWISVANMADVPASCKDAQAFFSPGVAAAMSASGAPWDRDLPAVKSKFAGGKSVDGWDSLDAWVTHNNPACVCAIYDWQHFPDWLQGVARVDLDSTKLADLKDRVARGREKWENDLFAKIEQRAGCKQDHGARGRMMGFVGRSRQALKALEISG